MTDTERINWLERQQGSGLISDDDKHWAVSSTGVVERTAGAAGGGVTMASLYELKGDYLTLLDSACEHADDEGQLSAEFVASLEQLKDDIGTKLENCCMALRNLQAERLAFEAEQKRLKAHADSLSKHEDRLKEYMRDCMIATGIAKRKAGLFSLSVCDSPPAVFVTDENLIPRDYFPPVEPKLARSLVSDALKSGKDVPGAELRRSQYLKIA